MVPSAVNGSFAVGRSESDTLAGATSCFNFANPKSNSFVPDFVSMILPGFRSRCVTPLRWALSIASAISMANCSTCSRGSAPFCKRCASVSPSRYSITRKSIPSCWPMSWRVQMCGWFRLAMVRASRSNRSRNSERSARCVGKTLMATMRSRRVSRALYTSPIPPAPICATTSYEPRRVPEVSAITFFPSELFASTLQTSSGRPRFAAAHAIRAALPRRA